MRNGFKAEQHLLKISLWVNTLSVFLDAVVGIHTDSSAVVFDAIYCAIGTISNLLLITFNRKIDGPASDEFQFGYYKLVPALIAMQTLLIIFSCGYAVLTSIRDIFNFHVVKNFMEVALLQSFLGILCFIMYLKFRASAKKYDNDVLSVQAMSWLLNFAESALIASVFFFGHFIKGTQFAGITPYIDPIAMLFLVIMLIREPAISFYQNFLDLLDRSTDITIRSKIKRALRKISRENSPYLRVRSILTRKAGKRVFIVVMCKKTPEISLEQMARLKDRLSAELSGESTDFDILFAV